MQIFHVFTPFFYLRFTAQFKFFFPFYGWANPPNYFFASFSSLGMPADADFPRFYPIFLFEVYSTV